MPPEQTNKTLAEEWLSRLFDDGIFTEFQALAEERKELAAVITAQGNINGRTVYAFSQDCSRLHGAFGLAQAAKLHHLYTLAIQTGCPIIGIYDSFGSIIDGSAAPLVAYSTLLKIHAQASGVIPRISIIAGKCTGSIAALACSSDFVVLSKNATLSSTPNQIISSGNAKETGLAIIDSENEFEALEWVRNCLKYIPNNNLSIPPLQQYIIPSEESESITSSKILNVNSVISIFADKNSIIKLYTSSKQKDVFSAFCTISGKTTGIVSLCAKHMIAKEYCSLIKFLRFCDAFSIPIILLTDTGEIIGDSTGEIMTSAVKFSCCCAELTTPFISLILNKAIGIACTSAFCADMTFAFENSVLAPFTPETAVEFLWHDRLKNAENLQIERKKLVEEYSATLGSAKRAAAMGCVDGIVTSKTLRKQVSSALQMFSSKRISTLPKKHGGML